MSDRSDQGTGPKYRVRREMNIKAIEKGINPNMIADLFTIMINEMVEMEISEFRNADTF